MNTEIMLRYWILSTWLFRSFPLMKWIYLSGVVFVVLGIPVYGIWATHVGFIIGVGILVFATFMNAIALPYQMLSIGSSKQIGVLPGIRNVSFLIFTLTCFCSSFVITLLIFFVQNQITIQSFLVVLFLVSVVLTGSIVIGQKYPGAQGLIFICFGALTRIYSFLMEIHFGLLALSSLVIWVVFFRYWKSWRPVKFYPSIFGSSREQLIAFHQHGDGQPHPLIEKYFSVKAKSLVGSLLQGSADGWGARLSSVIFVFFFLLIAVGAFFTVFDEGDFQRFFELIGQANIYFVYYLMAYALLMICFRNISKAWIYFDGRRDSYFNAIERFYCSWTLVFSIPFLVVHIGIVYFLLGGRLYGELIWLSVIYSWIGLAVMFYIHVFVYQKTKGDLRWNGGLGAVLMLMLVIPVVACNLKWVEHKSQIINWAYFFMVASALGVLALRYWVKKQWISVDFVRVKS